MNEEIIDISDEETPMNRLSDTTAFKKKKILREFKKMKASDRKRTACFSSSDESSDNSQASTIVNWKVREKKPEKVRPSVLSAKQYLKSKKYKLKESMGDTSHMSTEMFVDKLIMRLEWLKCKIAEQHEIAKTLKKNNNKMKRTIMDLQSKGCEENCSSSDESFIIF